MGIVAYCYMTEIFVFLWEFYFCFEGWGWLLWVPKSAIPAHLVLRVRSPGRGALLPRAYDESPLKAQECGRGGSHAQHLTKRLK